MFKRKVLDIYIKNQILKFFKYSYEALKRYIDGFKVLKCL